jgi:hypothetical protein
MTKSRKKVEKSKIAKPVRKSVEKVECPFCHAFIGKLGLDQHVKHKHGEPSVENRTNQRPQGDVVVLPDAVEPLGSDSSPLSNTDGLPLSELRLEDAGRISLPTLPKKPVEREVVADVFTEKGMIGLLDIVFDRIAALRGDFWKLTDKEKETIADPLTKVANKYVGKIVGKYSDEALLVVALGTVVLGKYMQDKSKNSKPFFKTAVGTVTDEGPPPEPESSGPDYSNVGLPDTEDLRDKYPGF